MKQSFITLVIPFAVDPSKVDAALDQLQNPARPELAKALGETRVIHFMSMHALAASPRSGGQLIIELSVDGGMRHALEQLVQHFEAPLRRVLDAAGIGAPQQRLAEFLARHHRPVGPGWFSTSGLNFSGTPGMTVARIQQEAELAAWVAQYLGSVPQHRTALQTLQAVREQLWREQSLKYAFTEEEWPFGMPPGSPIVRALLALRDAVAALLWPLLPLPLLAFGLCSWFFGLGVGVGAGGLLAALELALIGALYLRLRRLERSDRPDDKVPSADTLLEIAKREDHVAQNHLRVLSELKPGLVRRIALRVAFFAIGQAAARLFAIGNLSSINTIHFARWIVLPGSSQLLFLSNYGGSWESYLEDFINKAHNGLTGIWSNTQGFPRARNVFFDGATDGARFKAWARRQQAPTLFWYSAYPSLTTGRIRINAAIRRGIAAARSEDEAAAWLRYLGAAPPSAIEVDDVPALVFGGLPRLRFGKGFLLPLPPSVEQAKAWLAQIERLASFGEKPGRLSSALLVAFTQSGLQKLGLTPDELATFPVAFQHGSARRARLLGDTVGDEPPDWKWGGRAKPVDAIVLVYGATEADLAELERRVKAANPGLLQPECCHTVQFRPLPDDKQKLREPFDFVDGISQPVIRGSSKAMRDVRPGQLLESGEIVLGYPDNLGFLPPTPTVAAQDDPHDLLTDGGLHRADPGQVSLRNLGCNGTYLVVRQLQQHVDRFNQFVDDAAAAAANARMVPGGVDAKEWISAKLVGRWKNGSSLVRYPLAPGPSPDNDFEFGTEDPDGLRCPFGAHIRRANPRESFDPGSKRQLAITNRHRILRTGRVYEGRDERGLLFMCLNADIERQFEFIQQSWMRAPSFHGLADEIDPVAVSRGAGDGNGAQAPTVLTIPTADGPLVLKGMTEFVTLRGSGYFFLPGRRALRFLAQSRSAAAGSAQAAE